MANFKKRMGCTIDEGFDKFHKNNPRIYEIFKIQVEKAIQRGKTKLSSKTILGGLRWEYFLETESDDGFKINDAFSSRYSRLYIEEHPENWDIFELRKLRS